MPPAAALPESIGPYRLERLAGAGASAWVYRAFDLNRAAPAALKLLRAPGEPPGLISAHAALGQLHHPNIVAHLDAGLHQGRTWLAYEWVKGHDLTRYTQPRWLLPPALALDVCAAIADGLAFAHAHGWIHRDLKPSNVRIHLPDHRVKLTDFGIARQPGHSETATGVLLGTPSYMAPELLLGEPPTARSDTYALGLMLYQLLSGQSPHDAVTLQGLLQQALKGQAAALDTRVGGLPPELTHLVHAMIERQPSSRPASAAEIANRLRELHDQLA
jgi:eukaryotic-like serine/threonine-protein kinase